MPVWAGVFGVMICAKDLQGTRFLVERIGKYLDRFKNIDEPPARRSDHEKIIIQINIPPLVIGDT